MKKSIYINLESVFGRPLSKSKNASLDVSLRMELSDRQMWKNGENSCTEQEFDGRYGYLHLTEFSLADQREIPMKAVFNDIHMIYALHCDSSFELSYGGETYIFENSLSRILYIPKGEYKLRLPKGQTNILIIYFNRKTISPKYEPHFGFMSQIFDAHDQKSPNVHISNLFPIDHRIRCTIEYFCQNLIDGQTNEAFIISMTTELISLGRQISIIGDLSYISDHSVGLIRTETYGFVVARTEVVSYTNVAKKFGLEYSMLNHFHLLYFGITFREYYNSVKLQTAVYLLLGDLTIKEVAYNLGYNTQNSFGKFFKRMTGETPSDWIKLQKVEEKLPLMERIRHN
ncbi:helix-turn-helix domain-containing protein [Sphingobacterium sp. JB170]|uniref:helix-turn-helix domain-containing protein n=1 Tax=Sphingobacterium sp. JB170 TaxID=1434842 RepID=UPI00097EC5EB|nr:helix-turn-helix domain-containing protein [Sphingobacterium sp. JB170]SJN49848.1 hypothetical protein FM107_19335 [Sphingobacterium sp. JB170]